MKRLLASPSLRPTLIYAILAALWILLSDRIVEVFVQDPVTIATIQTFKGLAFVAATTWLVYVLVRRELDRVETVRKELEASESRYRLTFEHAPAGIAQVAVDGQLMLVNEQLCAMLGYSRTELVGMSYLDITHPEDLDLSKKSFQRILQNPQSGQVFEKRYLRKDGSTLWTLVRTILVQAPEGGAAYVLSIIVDATGEKAALDQLRQSEERFAKAFRTSPDAVAISRVKDGVYLEVNEGFVALTGYTPDDVLGRSSLEVNIWANPADRKRMVDILTRQGEVNSFEFPFQTKDGVVRIGAMSARLIDMAGEPCLLSITRDITGERAALDKLRQSEERFAKAFHTSPDSVAINRAVDGMYLEVNDGFVAITGYTLQDVAGKTSLELNIWADPADRRRMIDMLARDQAMTNFEFPFKKKNGEILIGLMSARLMEMDGEDCVLTITRDITERKRMEEDLRRTTHRLEALHDIDRGILAARSPEAIVDVALERLRQLVRTDRLSVILFPLGGEPPLILAAKYTGETSLSAGRPYNAEHDPNVREWRMGHIVIEEDLRALAELTPTQQKLLAEGILATTNFPMRVQETLVGVLNVGKKQPGPFEPGDMAIAREVADQLAIAIHQSQLYTEVRRYSEELEQRVQERTRELWTANERLKELDQLKSKFVSDVSHELRTPVTNLGMYLYLLKRAGAEKQAEYLMVLEEQAERLKTMVEGILDLSRLELARQNMRLEPVDLNQIVGQVVIAHQPRAQAAGLGLTFSPHKAQPQVRGDSNQLNQVVTNLVANAINYTDTGQVAVEVVQDATAAHVGLIVRDTGVGITPEDMDHIFERFYRGGQAVQQAIPGTGLGLGIVKEIVDLHSGRIEVESTPGEGSTFTVWLPIDAAPARANPASNREAPDRSPDMHISEK